MIEWPISEEARTWALKREQEITQSDVVKNRENYTGFCAPLRYTKGSVGEWVFREYLESEDVYFKTDDSVGASDKLDFLVRHQRAGLIRLDVKTSYDQEIKVNQAQARVKNPDGYVLVERNEELTQAVIVGYISRVEFFKRCTEKTFKNGGRAFVVPPEVLHPVESDLMPKLSRGARAWRFVLESGAGTMISQRALSSKEALEAVRNKFGGNPEVARL